MNCQSLVGKKALFDNFTVCNNLDVIIGSESWFNPSISSSEIFLPKFMVFRKDREDGYGGVFLACSRDFAWQEFPLQTGCEAVACKTVLNNHQSLIIISIYRPPNSDSQYFESICSLIHDIMLENPKSIVWIGSDFNLPNINWIDNFISMVLVNQKALQKI